MYKKLVLIICLLFGISLAFAEYICMERRASYGSGEVKSSEEPPIHASINGDMFTATFLEDLGSVSVSISTAGGDSVHNQNALFTSVNWKNPRLPLKSDTMFFVCNEQTFNLLQRFTYNYL